MYCDSYCYLLTSYFFRNLVIEEIGQSEAYVMGTSSEGRLYCLMWTMNLFSISNLRDAVIDFFIMF